MNGFTLNEGELLKKYGQTKQLEIERLLSQYGTSLKDMRELYPQLTETIAQRRLTTAFPTQPLFFTSYEAAEMGLRLDEGWMLKMSPTEGNGGYTSSIITPQKWEITENDLYIAPSGEQYSRADMEALLGVPTGGLEATTRALSIKDLTEEGQRLYEEYQQAGGALDVKGWVDLRERQQLETEQVFGAVFPEQDIQEVLDYMAANPEGFLADIREIGPTEDMVAFLKTLEFEDAEGNAVHLTDADIQELFAPTVVPEYAPESWIKDNILDPLYAGAVSFIHGLKMAFTSVLPATLTEPIPYPQQVPTETAPGLLPGSRAWYEAATFEPTAIEQRQEEIKVIKEEQVNHFLQLMQENDAWIQEHPELTPKPLYLESPFEHTELFKDPGYYAYSITSSLAYTAATMGTIIAVSAVATPFVGVPAGLLVAGAPEAASMTEELVKQGIPFEEAAKWGSIYGLAAGGIETVSDLPFIGLVFKPVKTAVQPMWNTLLRGTASRLAKAAITAAVIPNIEGLEEAITQAVHNAILKHYDETVSILDGVSHAYIQGLIASLPFMVIGGRASFRTFRTSLSEETGTQYDKLVSDFEKAGLTKQQAQVQAANELAKTPEGEAELSKAIEAAQEEYYEEHPELTRPSMEVVMPELAEDVLQEIEITREMAKRGMPEIATGQEYAATVYRGYKVGGEAVDEGLFGKGTYYTTSQEYAETYDGKEVTTVNLKNPFVINTQQEAEAFWNETTRPAREQAIREGKTVEEADELAARAARDYLESRGYDGLIARNIIEKGDEVVVFHPEKAAGVPTTEAGMPEAGVEAPVEPIEVSTRRQLEGLGGMYQEWWSKRKTADDTKAALAKFVKVNLPMDARGKFITAVAKVKTDAQLTALMTRVMEFAESNAQKVLKAEVRTELKEARAKIKDHILKGKFTPETQRLLDVLNHNLELDRDTAREKIVTNIRAYESGELSYEEMFKANEALNFAGIDGMSSEELANLLNYIKSLEAIGRSERQAKQEIATEEIKTVSADISNILTGGKGLKTGIGAVPRKGLAAKPGWLDTFVNWQYGIDNLADKLSKFDTTSKPYQSVISTFVSQVHRATNRQFIGTKEAYSKVKDAVGEVFGVKGGRAINEVLNGLDEEVNLGTFELTAEYVANHPGATTITIKMTRNEMLAKYMQMQDRTLDNTFTTGMGWSMEVRNAIENNLTAEEKKLVDVFFQFYEDYYNTINPIYQELYNVDVPHNPRYSPIRRDFEADITESILTFQDAAQYASVLNGSLKARQRNIRPLKFNGATQILSNHIEQMEHFKAWAITMRDMRRVFGNTEIKQAIEQYHGQGIVQLIDKFMNQMARGGIETAATNRVADWLRRNFTRSILAIKPVIALKQIPSLFAYVSDQEMGVTGFVSGIADFWTSPIAHFKFLYKNSEGFRARIQAGFERDIAAALAQHGNKEIAGRGSIKNWFMLQIRFGDTFAVTQGMWAKYRDGLNKGLSQAEAIATAEDLTNRTQPSFGIDTLSAIQNGGSWLKLMTMFQNQPNKYFRLIGDNLRNFKYGRGSRAKAAGTILLAWVVLPMMFQYIADAFQWKPERQARAGILGPLNFILIGGQMVQSIWGWLTNEPFDYQVSPVAQTADDLRNIFLKAKKLISQGQDPYKDISLDDVAALVEYLAKAAGQITGLPTPYFVQVEKGIRTKLQEGEDINIKDFLFSQWALQPPAKNAEQKVEDLNLKLGEVKEGQEDKPLSERELNLYTTIDWFRDIGNVYSNVLPQDILDNPNASKESKAWAEYEIARSQADILPNIALYQINTEDNDDTIINYYQQWKARERITSLAQLKEFDALYPKAYLGNVSRQQYELLVKYLENELLTKDAFLDIHPELKINPRDEWLKANPIGNARLALAGKAKLLTLEAYNQFKGLLETLDIPTDAIPSMTLPPEGSVENYFKYGEMGEEYGWNSWEVQLILAKDNDLLEFLGREPIDSPIEALELKVKNRKLFDLMDSYSDKDSPQYLDDTFKGPDGLTARDIAIQRLYADNPDFKDDVRRIEALSEGTKENPTPDEIVEGWVERGQKVDEYGANSAEVKLWLIDNKGVHQWALDNKLLTDDGSDWNEPILRLDVQYGDKFDEYDAYDDKASPLYIADDTARGNKREAMLFDTKGMTSFGVAYYTKEALKKDIPENLVNTYVGYYGVRKKEGVDYSKTGWYDDDWYLIENMDFYDTMVTMRLWQERDFSKVPTREVFNLYQTYYTKHEGQERITFRIQHPELDAWLVWAKQYSFASDATRDIYSHHPEEFLAYWPR